MSGWPGEEEPSASEAETQVRPPPSPVESERRTAIRRSARSSGVTSDGEVVALALLEVAGAIDRLTREVREGRERD